ncbi:hypothetical protein L1987_45674 [Smallanthus sonchifolius]|uniref:Uncharacterized protein n=1 Tax=Smallanthus sonchifolius TaxID=185202 RepID=A0ACB9FX39_9ASTR|nr:hypothetical protein L1987_45674 [Smallanthus sonchifolius]
MDALLGKQDAPLEASVPEDADFDAIQWWWFLEEDMDWCPGWINKPGKKSFPDVQPEPSVEDSDDSPDLAEDVRPPGEGNDEQSIFHVEGEPYCMGNEIQSGEVT